MTTVAGLQRALGRLRRGERGTSLIELAVVTAILTVVMAMALAGLVSAQHANQGNGDRVGNLDQARLLMAYTTRDFRTAVRLTPAVSPFVSAGPTDVTFTAALDNTSAPVQIRLWVNANHELLEDIYQPSGTAPNYTYTTGVTRNIARFIANTAAHPIFTYNDATVTPNLGGSAIAPGTTLTAAQLLLVHAVVIDFYVRNTSVFSINATELTTRVSLPNLDYNPNGSYSS